MNILPNLTKSYILKHVPEEQIFSRYFGIPTYEILESAETNSKIHSPIREDDNPSLGFYYNNNGKLKARDFAGYFWGDCFDAVAFRLSLDANVGNHFMLILDRVAKDFKIHRYKNSNDIITYERSQILKKKEYVEFSIEHRNWNKFDVEYWKGLTGKHLEKNLILPVRHLWVNKQVAYKYKDNDLCYSYYLGQNKWKLYFPQRPKKFRFMSNGSTVQGINTLKPARIGIMTKSYKDVVYLRYFKEKYNLDSLAPSSENDLININQYNYLAKKADVWFSFMDYDNTGIHLSWNLRKQYGFIPLFLNEKTWARKQGLKGCKDFSDYAMKFGMKEADKLLFTMLSKHIEL